MDGGSHGYDGSVGYSYGFYREMAPDWLDLAARLAGHVPPARGQSPSFRYLYLGSGQGMGLCLLAAANPDAEFLGIDLQGEHIAHAEALSAGAELRNVRFVQADFVDLAAAWPADFGTFDYVVLHGVYTWVSPFVQEAIVGCLAHAVRPDGLVYASYNTQPGWLGTMPFQHISRLIRDTGGKASGAAIEESVQLFDRLRAGGAATFQILPALKARLDAVKTRSTGYLVQEYMHASWRPLWHSDVAGAFGRSGLAYVGSATLAETMLPGVLPPPLRDTILGQQGDALRQDVQDFVVNQSFRRDVFRRGTESGGGRDPAAIGRTRVHLVSPPGAGATITLETAFGEVALQYPAFAQVVDALRGGPKSIGELAELPDMRKQGMANAVQILLLLIHARMLAVGTDAAGGAEAAWRLNAAVARGAAEGLPYDHIAVPALGGAIAVGEVDLLLLDAWLAVSGEADAAMLAAGVAARLGRLGKTPIEGGRLAALAKTFLDQSLPRWRGLGMFG
jgi:SAM-dependent methyltransferase